MHHRSQLPVIKNGKVVGLLTGNTLARWAGGQLAVGLVDFADHTIGQVLRHTEYADNWMLVPREALVAEIVDLLDRAEAAGKRLDAILVTTFTSAPAAPRQK
jgi:predicted transcriptional regulator